ncbi:MAG TPA: sugar phosphate isomerase/epimerase [Pyrinomonadaceae bacterium]|nr:sugar phosphate isomerase/epimerase [Pyrinomonadaceae bacterium]
MALLSRRHFIVSLGAVAAASAVPVKTFAGAPEAPLYPPVDVSYFNSPITPAPGRIHFGYAAITWNGNDAQAIKEISELGFPGIQLRSNILKDYGERPKALRDLLDQNQLEMVALSSGGVSIAPGSENDEIAKHTRNARFVHDAGGHYLQVTDSARPKGRKPEAADFKKLGQVLSEIGKRAVDLDVPVGYHNHMGSLGEAPDEVDRIMEAADPRYVKLELDIAHYRQGGGDPARAIRQYHDRLLFLHLKDVESLATSDERGRAYRWVVLGRGRVDLPAIFAALKDVKFRGWAVIELDSVPDKSRTPKECALINKKYVEEKLNIKI